MSQVGPWIGRPKMRPEKIINRQIHERVGLRRNRLVTLHLLPHELKESPRRTGPAPRERCRRLESQMRDQRLTRQMKTKPFGQSVRLEVRSAALWHRQPPDRLTPTR